MKLNSQSGLRVLYILTYLSGFSGLIYQIVWHKYFAILVGSHARATAVVLAIFMLGLGLGYKFFGYWTHWKRWNLVFTYVLVEIGLGTYALIFPGLYALIFPVLGNVYGVFGISSIWVDILLSLLLMGIPTFLMGGTLPLLTQIFSPDIENASEIHARIYGFNTVGAAFGAFVTGYFIIPLVGLNDAMRVGAFFNYLIGLIAMLVFVKSWEPLPAPKLSHHKFFAWDNFRMPLSQYLVLAVGFLSGFYVLTLETTLIRLVGLSTGSANYNFTLIVTIFIFGLGIGALLVRKISTFTYGHLLWNQAIIALLLYLVYLTGDYWAYWVHLIRIAFRDQIQNFYPFQLALGLGLTSLLLLPVAACGLTLPICFHLLKEKKENLGQRVGLLYSVNIIGTLFGTIVGGHLLFYWWNIDSIFKFCISLAVLSAALSGYNYWKARSFSKVSLLGSFSTCAVVVVATILAPLYDKERFIQPFRQAEPVEVSYRGAKAFGEFLSRNTKYLFYKDDPNTSVGIGHSTHEGKEVSRTILINGKSDGNTSGDLFTTVMLAHIPAILGKKIERVCTVGFGTGITAGTLALYDRVKEVHILEISPILIKNASYFDRYNNWVSQNPKVKFHEMDAFRFLIGSNDEYDVIVSEPSNPWVSGIENLYSKEFYSIVKGKLSPEGLFVQWIHTYSFNDRLFQMVLRTMATQFANLTVFQLRGGDYAIMGSQSPFSNDDLKLASERFQSEPLIKSKLESHGISNFETLLAYEVIPPTLIEDLSRGEEIHTLENPRLSNGAAKAFFAKESVDIDSFRRRSASYYRTVSDSLYAKWTRVHVPSKEALEAMHKSVCENPVSSVRFICREHIAYRKASQAGYEPPNYAQNLFNSRDLASISPRVSHPDKKKVYTIEDVREIYNQFEIVKRYYSPVAQFKVDDLVADLNACLKSSTPSEGVYGECLLQKVLILQTMHFGEAVAMPSIEVYFQWFSSLPESFANYEKFKKAKGILENIVAEQQKLKTTGLN